MSSPINNLYEFGSFRLDTEERTLLQEGKPLTLTPKDYEILLALVERSGRITEKDELIQKVWPDTFVGEENLARHVSTLRKTLGENSGEPKYIETIPKRGYRFVAEVRTIPVEGAESADLAVETHSLPRIVTEEEVIEPAVVTLNDSQDKLPATHLEAGSAPRSRSLPPPIRHSGRRIGIGLAFLSAPLLAGALLLYYFYFHRQPVLTDKDTILLADFANTTGDPVFDGTLRQGLAAQLEQSPFLSLFPDTRVGQALRLMGRSPDERLTSETAREICRRQGLKAMVGGAIAPLGSHYVITLEAGDHNGEVVAREQVEAESKEQVLRALAQAANRLRERLGESLGSIEMFKGELTTSSLEALKADTQGRELASRGKWREAIPLYKLATELDPDFAMAYLGLAVSHYNLRQRRPAAVYMEKAYASRDRVSEWERLRITHHHYRTVTGETDKSIEALNLHKQTYPRDFVPHASLSTAYNRTGQFEKAVAAAREAIRLNPITSSTHANLAVALLRLDRYDEAVEVSKRALEELKLDNDRLHGVNYHVAFIRGDAATMKRLVNALSGKPNEHAALGWQSGAAAFAGQWARAREFARRGIDLAARGDANEMAAQYAAQVSLNAALFDQRAQARAAAAQTLALERSQLYIPQAALTLALCGETTEARSLIDEMIKEYPKDSLINSLWLPVIRAATELEGGNAGAAIDLLQLPGHYEAAAEFWPQYLRGRAYLKLNRAGEAAAEFRKILDHRGQAPLSVLYPLAHLGLARAEALSGDAAKARQSYQDFLALWKDADVDLLALIEAKKEFEKVK